MFNLDKEVKSYEKAVNKLRIKFIDRLTDKYRANQTRQASIEAAKIELEVEDAALDGENYQIEEAAKKVNVTIKGENK